MQKKCIFVDYMEELLRAQGLRVTDFRLAVLKIFEQHSTALSSEEIERQLKDFDRITLYRTLKSFREKGIIHEIVMPDGAKTMALCAEECHHADHEHHHEHVHFKCKVCENIFCLDIDRYPQLNLPGFEVDQMEIQVFGTCQACMCS